MTQCFYTDYHVLTYPYFFFHSEPHGFAINRVEFLFRIYKAPIYSASIYPHLFQLQKYYLLFFQLQQIPHEQQSVPDNTVTSLMSCLLAFLNIYSQKLVIMTPVRNFQDPPNFLSLNNSFVLTNFSIIFFFLEIIFFTWK